MIWIYIIFLLMTSCYIVVSTLLYVGVSRLRRKAAGNSIHSRRNCLNGDKNKNPDILPFVSVLVAARDEESKIAGCLKSLVDQKYPADLYEIVVVNDRSTDGTATIISEYQRKYDRVKFINVKSNFSGLTGKQNALNEGLRICKGEIILNTDADCIAGPFWICRTVEHFKPEVGLTLGFTKARNINGSESLFSDLQSLDVLFLMDSAAGAIGMKVAITGLGRNLAYRRQVLNSMDYGDMGYNITEDTALIRRIDKDSDWEIAVVYDRDAVVSTFAEEGLKQFLSQRLRWSMGGRSTKLWLRILLRIIYMFHLALVVFLPLMLFIPSLTAVTLSAFFIKGILDFVRCWRVCREFGRMDLLKLIVLYEVFMIYYSAFLALMSIFVRKVYWKGEFYRKNTRHIDSV